MQVVKLVGQMAILTVVYGSGELLVRVSHLPLPGSAVGMGLLLLLFVSGWVKVSWVEELADLLLGQFSLLLLPALVGLKEVWPLIAGHVAPLATVVLASTVAGLVCAAAAVIFTAKWFSPDRRLAYEH